jgi:lipid II:glycine glycyltransferase (peptidoglycan interpeptide bridge formation enzyme)
MESSKINKVTYYDEELRQSENWAKYLTTLGWTSVRTSSGINIEHRKLGFLSIVKIQHPKPLTTQDLEEIETICKKHKALFIKIEPSIGQDIKILEEKNYRKSHYPMLPPATIYTDLTKTEEELWNAVSKSGKYAIRRAQREGAKIEIYKNPSEEKLKIFNEVAQHTAKKQKFYVNTLKDLIAKTEIFGDNAFLALSYTKENQLAGGIYYLANKNCVWFMHGGTSDIGRKGKEGHELFWKSFLYFKELGFEILDLEGKDDDRFPTFTKNWGGFSHFKERFGGNIVSFPYPHIKPLRPILKLLQKVYGTLPL